MLKSLQAKWKVSPARLVLILATFALGGSGTGWIGKKVMAWLSIDSPFLFVPVYVIIVTIIWPFAVLLVSIPLGQFSFFKMYIGKLANKLTLNKSRAGKKESTDIKKNIVLFASGAGSNAQQIIQHFSNSPVATVSLVVCNKPGAGVIAIAEKAGVAVLLIEKEHFLSGDGYLPQLKNAGADLIVLAGFLWKMPAILVTAFPRRIINIHPALLPKFGGKGMYGLHVHQSVINTGDVQSGITIHYVDEHYDSGDIIFQTACPVLDGDTPEVLATRIHTLEHLHYPVVIEEILNSQTS
ncbi:MAG: phosphoribosylglycinamide formyltransferase [Bacteroidota bacterium]